MTETYPAMNLFLDFCVIGILITGIWLFRWPHRAKFGNLTAAFALACAAALILYRNGIMHPNIVLFSLVIGSVAGFWVARRITMIQIPAMVAFQHGAGGIAAFFLSFAELMRGAQNFGMVNEISGLLGLAIGSLTFSGSMIAGGKLSNKLEQTPRILPKHTLLVIINLIGIIMLIVAALFAPTESRIYFYILIICMSILFGVIFSIRIGGADMPVLISFLNATAGVAAAFCGMIIENKLLISCGATVAASGSILTHVMCKAMNRSLYRVFIPVESLSSKNEITEDNKIDTDSIESKTDHQQTIQKQQSIESKSFQKVHEYALDADNIIIVPGYGMAVAQAQFAVIELSNLMISMEKRELFLNNIRLQRQLEKKYTFENIIGTSEAMMAVFKTINYVKDSKTTVLIRGETGTGKELVARAIHFNSDKASKPYLPVNCAALNENLLASELFGHVKGAFTGAISDKSGLFEAAKGGTIFLDEIGDIGTGLQQTFLRALENGEIQPVGSFERKKVPVRIIAATNKNLETMVEQGSFRKDLYYRLNVVIIDLPPLRERKGDIRILAHHFLKQFSSQNNKNINHISQEVLKLLEDYTWPGNVRELENIIERATLFETSQNITRDSLPHALTMPSSVSGIKSSSKDIKSLEQLSKKHIIKVLETTNQNKTQASKLLGIDRSTLWRIMKRLGMN